MTEKLKRFWDREKTKKQWISGPGRVAATRISTKRRWRKTPENWQKLLKEKLEKYKKELSLRSGTPDFIQEVRREDCETDLTKDLEELGITLEEKPEEYAWAKSRKTAGHSKMVVRDPAVPAMVTTFAERPPLRMRMSGIQSQDYYSYWESMEHNARVMFERVRPDYEKLYLDRRQRGKDWPPQTPYSALLGATDDFGFRFCYWTQLERDQYVDLMKRAGATALPEVKLCTPELLADEDDDEEIDESSIMEDDALILFECLTCGKEGMHDIDCAAITIAPVAASVRQLEVFDMFWADGLSVMNDQNSYMPREFYLEERIAQVPRRWEWTYDPCSNKHHVWASDFRYHHPTEVPYIAPKWALNADHVLCIECNEMGRHQERCYLKAAPVQLLRDPEDQGRYHKAITLRGFEMTLPAGGNLEEIHPTEEIAGFSSLGIDLYRQYDDPHLYGMVRLEPTASWKRVPQMEDFIQEGNRGGKFLVFDEGNSPGNRSDGVRIPQSRDPRYFPLKLWDHCCRPVSVEL